MFCSRLIRAWKGFLRQGRNLNGFWMKVKVAVFFVKLFSLCWQCFAQDWFESETDISPVMRMNLFPTVLKLWRRKKWTKFVEIINPGLSETPAIYDAAQAEWSWKYKMEIKDSFLSFFQIHIIGSKWKHRSVWVLEHKLSEKIAASVRIFSTSMKIIPFKFKFNKHVLLSIWQ